MSCGVGHRSSSDLALLWLWHRPAAVAPVKSLAWEPPYATRAALKKKFKKIKNLKHTIWRTRTFGGEQTEYETVYLGFSSGSVTNLLLTVDEPSNPLCLVSGSVKRVGLD